MPGGDPAAGGAAENRRRHASVGVVAPGRRQCQAEATWAGARGFAAGLLGGGGAVLLLSRLSPGFRTKVGVRCARGLRRAARARQASCRCRWCRSPPPGRRAGFGSGPRPRRTGLPRPAAARGRGPALRNASRGGPAAAFARLGRRDRAVGKCTDPEGPLADGGRGSGKTALAVSPAFYLFTLWGEQVLTACVRRGRDFDRISERNT